MYVQRRRKRIEIWTPAKLNLFLEVLSRRLDGYHEIETLMVPVSLFDTLQLSRRRDECLRLTAEWSLGNQMRSTRSRDLSSGGDLPSDSDNLVYRAIARLRDRAWQEDGVRTVGIDVCLRKRIPAAAGLGGGSSDAAASLVGANELWQLGWSHDRLAALAAELGSDVPFFLGGAAGACRGRGDRVEVLRPTAPLYFVVVRPPQGLSTAEVYRHTQIPESPRRMADFLAAFRSRHVADWSHRAFNRLQESALRLAPWLESLREQFQRVGVLAHQLSGSGSCYFGICRHLKQARQVAALLRSRCVGRTFCVASVTSGPCAVL